MIMTSHSYRLLSSTRPTLQRKQGATRDHSERREIMDESGERSGCPGNKPGRTC